MREEELSPITGLSYRKYSWYVPSMIDLFAPRVPFLLHRIFHIGQAQKIYGFSVNFLSFPGFFGWCESWRLMPSSSRLSYDLAEYLEMDRHCERSAAIQLYCCNWVAALRSWVTDYDTQSKLRHLTLGNLWLTLFLYTCD